MENTGEASDKSEETPKMEVKKTNWENKPWSWALRVNVDASGVFTYLEGLGRLFLFIQDVSSFLSELFR